MTELWSEEYLEGVQAHFDHDGSASRKNVLDLFEQLKLTRARLAIAETAADAGGEALLALLDVVRKEPTMQRRELVPIGIQCTKAAATIANAKAARK